MGYVHKRSILHDLIQFHNINLVAIQEIKKQNFSNRSLKALAYKFDTWIQLPVVGLSCGILVGV
jgi:hypothetical protein